MKIAMTITIDETCGCEPRILAAFKPGHEGRAQTDVGHPDGRDSADLVLVCQTTTAGLARLGTAVQHGIELVNPDAAVRRTKAKRERRPKRPTADSWMQPCPKCRGTRFEECEHCHGRAHWTTGGHVRGTEFCVPTVEHTCHVCKGTGRSDKPCGECGGKGEVKDV